MRTRSMSATLFGIAAFFSAAPAAAQTAETRGLAPSFEVGTTVGGLAIFPAFGVRAAVGLSPRFAIEGAGEYIPWILDERGWHHFILQGQLRHTFRRGDRWNWHATYGAAFFTRLSDASSEERRIRIETPAASVGIGAEHPVSRHVAFRWDAQAALSLGGAIPIPRGSIGITWR